MKKGIIFLFLLVFNFNFINGQIMKIPDKVLEYHKLCNDATWAQFKNNNVLAYIIFRKAFKISPPKSSHVNLYIKSCIKLDSLTEAKKWIEYSILNFGCPYSIYYRNDYGLTESDKRFTEVKNKEVELLDKFYTYQRAQDIAELYHCFKNDIFFRNFLSSFNFENCTDKQNVSDGIAIQYDSIYTLPAIKELIRKYNFPDDYDIGMMYTSPFGFILRHVLNGDKDKKMLDSALFNNKISPKEYASIVDHIYNINYTTLHPYKNYGCKTKRINNASIIGEIDDIEHVDERRAKIGLMPLWMDAKIHKINLSLEYIDWLKKANIPYE